MSEAPSEAGGGYALYGLPAGGFDIEWRGQKIGRLVRSDPTGWVALLTKAARESKIPSPFTGFEHDFKSLIEALDWLGNPPVKRVHEREQ